MGYAEEIKKAKTAVATAGTVHGLVHAMLRFHDLVHSPQQFLEELAGKAFHEIRDHGVVGLWISPTQSYEDEEELDCWVVWPTSDRFDVTKHTEAARVVASFMYAKANVKPVAIDEAAQYDDFFVASRFSVILGEKPPVTG